MKRRTLSLTTTLALIAVLVAGIVLGGLAPRTAMAADTYTTLPLNQGWVAPSLIQNDNDWSGVTGIAGYTGQGFVAADEVDPQTVLTPVSNTADYHVKANVTSMDTVTAGSAGVFEYHGGYMGGPADNIVALHASSSGIYNAPHLMLFLDTRGYSNIQVAYNLVDIHEGWTDTPVALQYRVVGQDANFINLPEGFRTVNVTTTFGVALPVSVVLPARAAGQAQVQVRIITTRQSGTDEFVGIDEIAVSGAPSGSTPVPTATSQPTATVAPTQPDPDVPLLKLYLPGLSRGG